MKGRDDGVDADGAGPVAGAGGDEVAACPTREAALLSALVSEKPSPTITATTGAIPPTVGLMSLLISLRPTLVASLFYGSGGNGAVTRVVTALSPHCAAPALPEGTEIPAARASVAHAAIAARMLGEVFVRPGGGVTSPLVGLGSGKFDTP